MQKFLISKEDSGQTAIKYLNRLLCEAPKGLIYKQIRNKNITLNEKKMTGNEILKTGDILFVFMSDETISKFKGNSLKDTKEYEKAFARFGEPDIIYEDEHIIIMNKPIGVLSQKSIPSDLSVNEWLIGYLLNKKVVDAASLAFFTPSVCNRLDRNTGGLILFGKTLFGTNTLNKIIKDRSVKKYYKTVVLGCLDKENNLSGYLKKDERLNKVTIKEEPFEGADYIKTNYIPLRYSKKLDLTELEVELVTGKTHQIRAHLSGIGHPVIGDEKYGLKKLNDNLRKTFGLKHHLLYSYKLVFPSLSEYPNVSDKIFTKTFDDVFNPFFED